MENKRMQLRRPRIGQFLCVLLAAALVQGCRTTRSSQDPLEPMVQEDDFGDTDPAEITVESVQQEEMLRQRAQLELRIGGGFPFDVFRPDVDPKIDPGLSLGGKFSFEAAKNLFLGVSGDWTNHDVEAAPVPDPGENQIQQMDSLNKYNVLATLDYDIPFRVWGEEANPLILRFGAGLGVNIEKFSERPNNINTFETFIGFLFRPSVGLRYEVMDHVLLFSELSYDFVPIRSLETTESAKLVGGEKSVFSAGTVWMGIAFEWH